MTSRDEVFAMDQHRKNLESRIIGLQQQLSIYPKRLVDEEGFPLANVDVHMVRNLRHELAILQTDHKQLMLELETSVLSKSALKPQSASHDQSPALVSGSNCAGSANAHDSPHVSASADESVFFRVFEVAEGGPAQAAGLTDGDTVRSVSSVSGLITHRTPSALQAVSQAVAASVGGCMSWRVVRSSGDLTLEVRPSVWSGRGVLGCRIAAVE